MYKDDKGFVNLGPPVKIPYGVEDICDAGLDGLLRKCDIASSRSPVQSQQHSVEARVSPVANLDRPGLPGSTKFKQVPKRVKKNDIVNTSDSLHIHMLDIKSSRVKQRSDNKGNCSSKPSAMSQSVGSCTAKTDDVIVDTGRKFNHMFKPRLVPRENQRSDKQL